jgi:hypothetical protein
VLNGSLLAQSEEIVLTISLGNTNGFMIPILASGLSACQVDRET